ncbi:MULTISPECIES: murein biosynthesis integral membrane protein MurJ [Carboxydothermus]|uniref:Probable lipid II flippase MurJ n=2 Tax=Carboxydothermus TaxID=129957 RepID=Q3AEN0_CARHZ|nr:MULTISPECIES: murein biosynthesis integral membrane protein MurJ [Carboxydothermus]ABB14444.1 integral membrane protein MviN [Carboxydothermus hydrogenoformans Z-2901]NYE56427.1 putative peptidoglycan lipid II flippase [Carboxydothermus ferrireducens DSM 11255]
MSKKIVLKATLLIMALTLTSRILGFVREMAIASVFGASKLVDAYLAAQIIPTFFASFIGGGLMVVVVPIINEFLAQKKHQEATYVTNSILTLSFLALGIIMVIGVFTAPSLIKFVGYGFQGDTLKLARTLSTWLFPLAVLMSLTQILTGVLNAYQHFFTPALGPVLNNVVLIAAVILLGKSQGIVALVGGTLAGWTIYLLIMLPAFKKTGFYFRPVLDIHHPAVVRAWEMFLPVIIGTTFTQINLLVDRMLASSLTEGSISALNYAAKLYQLPLGLISLAVSSAIFPSLSILAAQGEKTRLLELTRFGLKLSTVISLPAQVGLMVLATPIVAVLFERGAFDARATELTAGALFFYSLAIVFYVINAVLTRLFYAQNDTLTPLKVGALAVLGNIGANLILVRFLAHRGLALGTSFAAILSNVLFFYFAQKKIGNLFDREMQSFFLKSLAASLLMGIGAYKIYDWLLFEGRAVALFTAILFGVTLYFVLLVVFGVEEVKYIKKLFLKFKAKLSL